ncbi:hypothetical protein MUK42_09181 [Musa troglodytarum]|uniref:Uncharacterized protein n=1 Tax=Musa troglodytarum TaxID=320322 RepID=A0A9E7K6Y3_9LILI|nr:hypothetical protein MUK42_09181 [Musa troglodytarum]
MAEKLIALGRSRQPWTFFTSTAIPISHASLLCSLPISPRSIPALGPSFRSDLDVIGLNQLNWTSSGVKINSDGSQHQLESAQSVDITLYPAESIEIFWNFSAYTDKSLEQGDGIGMNRIMAITWIGDWPGSPKST